MKKILISVSITLLLVGGYFVGQNQLSNSALQSTFTVVKPVYTNRAVPIPVQNTVPNFENDVKSQGKDSKASGSPDVASSIESSIGNPLSKYIIKTGTVDIKISRNSLTKNYDKVVAIIKADGGYVEQNQSARHSATITVRIPSDKLDSELVSFRKLGTITNQSLQSNDQGFTVKDNQARLSILQQRKDVLVAALVKANASDTQNIQEQIFEVQGEIETLQGEQDLLNDQIAMSSVTITLTEKGQKVSAVNDHQKSLIAKSWDKASKSLLTSFGGIIIVIGATFPFILLILIIGVIYIRARRNKSKNNITK